MNLKRAFLYVLGVVGLVAVVAVPAMARKGGGVGGPEACGTAGGSLTWSPKVVWPPNHKLVPVTITWNEDDGDGDSNTVSVTGIQSIGVDDKGAGQPSAKQGPDYTGVGNSGSAADGDPANVTVMVRAERSGTDKAGRQYMISVHCSDTAHSGDAMATVTVPHDMGNHTGTSTKSASRPASSSSSLAFGGGALSLPKL